MANRRKPRRGILLLVCLVLLVLFLLLGITFVLLSGNVRKGAVSYQRSHEHRDNSPQLMDAVLMDLIRGGTDSKSPFFHSNLLADVYGQPALRGKVDGVSSPSPANGQLTRIGVLQDGGFTLSQVRGYYNGLVLTMVTGEAQNQSTRIVDYEYDDSGTPALGVFTVVSFSTGVGPSVNDIVLVNGRPFSGIGDPTKTPNRMYMGNNTSALVGGNEEYDAPDYNNPWLAVVLPGAHLGIHIKPSFHDPKLIEHAGGGSLPADSIYRQVSFRPIPGDHPNFTGSNPNFDPFDGPWDVDNDGSGVPDSIWMDVGLPSQTLPDGRVVKPLVAFLIRDMDGRLNLNAHGSGFHYDQLAAAYDPSINAPLAGGATSADFFERGSGYGPPEINLAAALGDLYGGAAELATIQSQYANLLVGATINGAPVSGRYGGASETVPGVAGGDLLSRIRYVHAFGIHEDISSPNNFLAPNPFLAPHDLRGDGVVALDQRGTPMYLEMGGSLDFTDSAYEIYLYDPALYGADSPFTVAELELILRPTDIDAGALPRRILSLAPRLAGFRDFVTTDSWDIPVAPVAVPSDTRASLGGAIPSHITDVLRARILSENPMADADAIINGLIEDASGYIDFPAVGPELLAGLPFNVNRPFGEGYDSNNNNVVDEPGDAWAGDYEDYVAGGNQFVEEFVYQNKLEQDVSTNVSAAAGAQYTNVPFDHNANGVSGVDGGNALNDVADQRSRHLYAKQLYFLLMLLSHQDADGEIFGASPPADNDKHFARRMAQYAVNVVDFRDSDEIMTPFEYDIHPFDGWSADGNVATDDGADTDVVWGCEAPVAVLTETLAFHNRRATDEIRDLNNTDLTTVNDPHDYNGGAGPDTDYDQLGLPVGTFIFEVYCPARTNPVDATYGNGNDVMRGNSVLPANPPPNAGPALLDSFGRLDLERMVGDSPVWRVAITEPHTTPADRISQRVTTNPYTTTMQPEQFTAFDTSSDLNIERYVWFATTAPTTDTHETFYNRSDPGSANLYPGEYLVVGPRQVTIISQLGNAPGDRQMIQLDHDTDNDGDTDVIVNITNPDNPTTNDYPAAGAIKVPKAIRCAAAAPTGWTGTGPMSVGLNVSEPLGSDYYPEPGKIGPLPAAVPELWSARDYRYSDPGDATVTLARDTPFDVTGGNTPNGDTPVALLAGLTDGYGTVENYRTAFLQRLANPGLPYNATTNPYLTVDWMPIDLTVYNRDAAKAGDPSASGSLGPMRLHSRERGDRGDLDATRVDLYNLWRPAFDVPPTTTGTGNGYSFDHDLVHSLGYLNNAFDGDLDGDYFGTPAYIANGEPKFPFPWITWNDRPFVSEYELLQVPASAPGMLTFEFEMPDGQTPPFNSYGAYDGFPFGHLLNFFHSASGTGTRAQLGRVFDYLRVPSLFAGVDTVFNPNTFADPVESVGSLRPPFNGWSKFREPGRININTIFHQNIWDGVINGHPGPTWEELVLFRRGYLQAPPADYQGDVLAYENGGNTDAPSFFAMPFRAAANGDLVATAAGSSLAKDIDTTLLRSSSLIDVAGNSVTFANNKDPATENDYDNTVRNSYFRYQSISRFGNLLTTRSNVYAVWMTIGYFEVAPVPVDAGHPDGFALGREVGEQTGDIRRHRAFYILDRTIPVGYDNGQDLNVEDVVRLRTHIE